MTACIERAERLRGCRLAFERAMRDGTSVKDAACAAARERYAEADRRLAQQRCAVRSTAIEADPDAGRPLMWWQR